MSTPVCGISYDNPVVSEANDLQDTNKLGQSVLFNPKLNILVMFTRHCLIKIYTTVKMFHNVSFLIFKK